MVAPSSKDLAPGVAFGSYVVKERIGRGGMASVYRAEHLLLNKPVALKVMDRALLSSAAARQRFLLEGRAAAAIKHPNVVDITDVGVHDGQPYLVMELLVGEDLDAHLQKHGPLDDASAIRLALPIVAALHAAHSSGVVHRDIKPSNIFVSVGPDEQMLPKVLDFGISKLTFDNARQDLVTTPQNQLLGTPRYLPPEALHGARELGPLSDQYSLGVVLYQCVTGTTPFGGDTLIALLNSLSRGAFEPARARQPSVSPGLDRVISRALSTDPAERFPSVKEMGRALLELAAERTQMVWGHSFKPPSQSSDELASKASTQPPATELIEREPDQRPRPLLRRVAYGAGLMLCGALGSALWSGLSQRAPSEPATVRQELVPLPPLPAPELGAPEPSVAAVPIRPAEVRPSAAAAERAPEPARSRPLRAPAKRTAAASRRGETESRAARHNEPSRPSAAAASAPNPASASASAAAERAAAARPATAPRARRQGANRSPLLD